MTRPSRLLQAVSVLHFISLFAEPLVLVAVAIKIWHSVTRDRQMAATDTSFSDIDFIIWVTLLIIFAVWLIGLIPFIFTAKSTLIRNIAAIKRIAQKSPWVKMLKVFGVLNMAISLFGFILIFWLDEGRRIGTERSLMPYVYIFLWLIRSVYCFFTAAWLTHQFRR